MCSFSNGDASLTIKVDNLSPPPSSVNQGSLSLVLLSYPGEAASGLSWLGGIWSLWRGGWMSELSWNMGLWCPGVLPSCSSMLLEAGASNLWPLDRQ